MNIVFQSLCLLIGIAFVASPAGAGPVGASVSVDGHGVSGCGSIGPTGHCVTIHLPDVQDCGLPQAAPGDVVTPYVYCQLGNILP